MSNLSEEEKKAMEYYKNNEYSFGFETDMDFETFKKAIGIEETEEDSFENHMIRFKTLINLIEKQQKELEQEKEKNRKLCTNCIFYNRDFISKDKIRETVNKLKKEEEKLRGSRDLESRTIIAMIIKKLEELLEEE